MMQYQTIMNFHILEDKTPCSQRPLKAYLRY